MTVVNPSYGDGVTLREAPSLWEGTPRRIVLRGGRLGLECRRLRRVESPLEFDQPRVEGHEPPVFAEPPGLRADHRRDRLVDAGGHRDAEVVVDLHHQFPEVRRVLVLEDLDGTPEAPVDDLDGDVRVVLEFVEDRLLPRALIDLDPGGGELGRVGLQLPQAGAPDRLLDVLGDHRGRAEVLLRPVGVVAAERLRVRLVHRVDQQELSGGEAHHEVVERHGLAARVAVHLEEGGDALVELGVLAGGLLLRLREGGDADLVAQVVDDGGEDDDGGAVAVGQVGNGVVDLATDDVGVHVKVSLCVRLRLNDRSATSKSGYRQAFLAPVLHWT